MGCTQSTTDVDKKPLIVDVQQIIADNAWCMFYYSRTKWQRLFLRRKNYTVDVPMNYFNFQVTDEELVLEEPHENKQDKHAKENDKKPQVNRQAEQLALEFRNSTGEKQTYNFKCEKTSKSTVTVTFHKGFSIGAKTNFSLGLPRIVDGKASAGIDMRVSVTKTTADTFERTLTTCATSDISVAPHSHYTASIDMEERHLLADFKVWVKMSMPAKEAPAFIKNKHGDTISFYKLRNLSELFPDHTHLVDESGETRSDAVQFVVEGHVDGMQQSCHRINLDDNKVVEQTQTLTQTEP